MNHGAAYYVLFFTTPTRLLYGPKTTDQIFVKQNYLRLHLLKLIQREYSKFRGQLKLKTSFKLGRYGDYLPSVNTSRGHEILHFMRKNFSVNFQPFFYCLYVLVKFHSAFRNSM
jgi:hypothetical protein